MFLLKIKNTKQKSSNKTKENVLGVPKELLERHGAVSEQVVISMAQGALEMFGSNWSIAVSGIAGPDGGTKEKPVGVVYIALAKKHFCHVIKKEFGAERDRNSIQHLTVLTSLNELRLALNSGS